MITKQNISLSDYVVQSEGNIVSDMGSEKVMLSIHNGKYYNLGEIGGGIWDLMKEPIQVEKMVSTLTSSYLVEKQECEEHVLSFLTHLLEEQLIQIASKE
ncbi:lasso peptide biosynthesis PqqD family chaperone [Bacillus niameyensis]|uniref:lasso peptide biosynthesis PqqD family chaperone n=1 Tax=Bacillus niameyensis TaxID=1522308 RepID=UPI0007867249|nr:lasso peptide biosynthesis PqqD family chaperone [Bacillus niameyensis]